MPQLRSIDRGESSDRERAGAFDLRRHGGEGEAARGKLIEVDQVLDDGDVRAEQGGVHGTFTAIGAIDVERVDTHARNVGPHESFGRGFGDVGVIDEVRVGTPLGGVAGLDQHRVAGQPGQIFVGDVDGSVAVDEISPTIQVHGGDGGYSLEFELGEVVTVGETMEGDIEVGAGVGAHRDEPDLERDAGAVDLLGGFTSQVVGDDRLGQPWVGGHAVGDHVTEVDELRHVSTLGTGKTHSTAVSDMSASPSLPTCDALWGRVLAGWGIPPAVPGVCKGLGLLQAEGVSMTSPHVSFTEMKHGTADDYALLDGFERKAAAGLADRLIAELADLEESLEGYRVTRLQHSLQSATRARLAGADTDWVVAALLHDIGDALAPYNHAEYAAAVVRPYVREEVSWVIEQHGVFQSYYYSHHLGGDRNGRDAFADHPWYQLCVDFCAQWDQNSFDPDGPIDSLESFVDELREVFARSPWDPAVIAPGPGKLVG